ncbi:Protein CBG13940 [Caenorhabditis briggsae]|uniref:Protein CBG13940 n=1 Tax=Caenorhabditis briggsae TaxID=6238 RepID=A8XIZ6_CAEBR|nr:Protein CBG13940 [Caenorhabditis briggsae]CAP32622.2 Protein CBG13940 [Caenorhabditis briggsae]
MLNAGLVEVEEERGRRPPFLEGVPKNILEKFEAIFKDRSMSWDQKKSKIDFLAQNVLTGDNLRKFQEFKAMKAKGDAEFRHKEARLSPAAQQANQKMRNLMGRERFQFMQGLNENVKQELMEMWRSRFGGAGQRMMRNRRI